MNFSPDLEFEDDYRHRRKIETAAEATKILREGNSAAWPVSEKERRESLAQLSELMEAIAERLHNDGVTWKDIAYRGEVTEREKLFSPNICTSDMLAHILTQSVNPDYLDAREALNRHFDQARFSVYKEVVGDEAASRTWANDEQDPSY